MIRRSLTADGDYALNSFIRDSEATIQAVYTRLRIFQGEWFLNLNEGVPYFQKILGKPFDLSAIERIIKGVIQSTEGVRSITSFDSNLDTATRRYTVTFTATTIYGDEFGDVLGVTSTGVI